MTHRDLDALAAFTRDYAAFQARKSGLATALGGLVVLLSFWVALLPRVFRVDLLQRPALEGFLLVPLLWLGLKEVLARRLYRGLGPVKPARDVAYERRLWLWTLGLAALLLTCLVAGLYGFVSGAMKAGPVRLSAGHPLNHPWPLLLWVPLVYLLPAPWLLRGVEEARAYLVLVGQSLLWLILLFVWTFGARPALEPLPRLAAVLGPLGFIALVIGLLAWGALAVVRGWKEHREFLALLRALPAED